jgi:hypothetical protein
MSVVRDRGRRYVAGHLSQSLITNHLSRLTSLTPSRARLPNGLAPIAVLA